MRRSGDNNARSLKVNQISETLEVQPIESLYVKGYQFVVVMQRIQGAGAFSSCDSDAHRTYKVELRCRPAVGRASESATSTLYIVHSFQMDT